MPSNNPAFKFSTTCVRAAFVADCPHMRVPAKIPIFNFMTSLHTYAVSGEQEKKKYVISHAQQKQSIRYDNKVFPVVFISLMRATKCWSLPDGFSYQIRRLIISSICFCPCEVSGNFTRAS